MFEKHYAPGGHYLKCKAPLTNLCVTHFVRSKFQFSLWNMHLFCLIISCSSKKAFRYLQILCWRESDSRPRKRTRWNKVHFSWSPHSKAPHRHNYTPPTHTHKVWRVYMNYPVCLLVCLSRVRLLVYCFTPYQRPWLYNGAPLVTFYDTLGIRRTYSRLKPSASSRGSVQSKLNLGYNFWTKGDRAFILQIGVPCGKIFLSVPKILTLWPSPWILTYL